MKYIDLTHPFTASVPVYPGDPEVKLNQVAGLTSEGFVNHELRMGMHVGTHIDAPAHMLEGGKSMLDYPPEKFFAKGHVVDVRGEASISERVLIGMEVEAGDCLLVYTGRGDLYGQAEYFHNYPLMEPGFASSLVEWGISFVGMDMPSPDQPPYEIHKLLLKNDILILENLTNIDFLLKLQKFMIVALPMRLSANAAPCRAVAVY